MTHVPEFFADGNVDILETAGALKFTFCSMRLNPITKEAEEVPAATIVLTGPSFQNLLKQSSELVKAGMQRQQEAQAAALAAKLNAQAPQPSAEPKPGDESDNLLQFPVPATETGPVAEPQGPEGG